MAENALKRAHRGSDQRPIWEDTERVGSSGIGLY